MAVAEKQSLHHVRREYRNPPLDPETLDPNPIRLFREWFDAACEARLLEPNAMSLATANRAGRVTCRTVLLKAYDENGFVFFSNYESEKAQQIRQNANVALLFPWLGMARQIEINGRAEKINAGESLAYFLKRPFKSRVGAWISTQSSVIPSRKLLETKFEEMCRKFAGGEVPLPGSWGGYRVVPDTMEFWQGGTHRLHDRFQYSRKPDGSWRIERLSP